MKGKTGESEAVFADLCRSFGARVLSLEGRVTADLMVVQQFPYSDNLVRKIEDGVSVRYRTGLLTLATAGLAKHDAFLRQFGIRKVYVPNKRFLGFLLEQRGAQSHFQDIKVEEVGLPFAKHRVFPEFTADWMIAAPTLFSFHSEGGKQQFLRTVNQLLNQIPPEDRVVYKPHNGNSRDYFAPRMHYRLAGWLDKIPAASKLLRSARRLPLPWLRMQIDRVETCTLHRTILRRATPMAQVTPYAGISLEAFLPEVRKGVIGGLSNTIWGTLYFDLRYYNCVDESRRRGLSELLDKRSDALLDLNLQFFGVPFCHGDLNTDVRKLGIVQSHERQGNLVEAILGDLERVREVEGAVA